MGDYSKKKLAAIDDTRNRVRWPIFFRRKLCEAKWRAVVSAHAVRTYGTAYGLHFLLKRCLKYISLSPFFSLRPFIQDTTEWPPVGHHPSYRAGFLQVFSTERDAHKKEIFISVCVAAHTIRRTEEFSGLPIHLSPPSLQVSWPPVFLSDWYANPRACVSCSNLLELI